MFTWAIGCGLFSYYLFFLGILGKLEYPYILFGTAIFILFSYFQVKKHFSVRKFYQSFLNASKLEKILFGLLALQISINLIGALGPEIAYDAVWYHLTIPRIWLLEHKIFFIENGPFSYSLLPKLIDIFYLAALSLSNEIGAKIIHWFFGILVGIVTYKIARHFTNQKYALLSVVLFFSNLVVGWQSTTAYIDLGRTFFESLAVLALLYATIYDSKNWRYITAIMLGLAILSKLIAITSLTAVLLIFISQRKYKDAIISGALALSIPAAWFVLNWLQTGNPIYPVFSGYDLASTSSVFDVLTIWFTSADPLSPAYMMLAPLLATWFIPAFSKNFITQTSEKNTLFKTISQYCLLVFILWAITPRTGGGRFILPYLPAFSVLIIYPLSQIKVKHIQNIGVGAVIFVSLFSSMYRFAANIKYIPVLLGTKSKQTFLQNNLPQNFGDNWYYLTDETLKTLYQQPTRPDNLEWNYKLIEEAKNENK